MVAGCLTSILGCSVTGRLQRRQTTASLSQLTRTERQERQQDSRPQVVKLRRDSNSFCMAPIDTLSDGERVMALRIEEVTVVSRMRSVPERNGRVTLDFIVTLPKQLLGKSRSVVITPILHKPDEAVPLEDLVIRGGRFSLLQERDYWQYGKYRWVYDPDSVEAERMFNRLVKFPYPEDVRLDSVVERRGMMEYYYSQEVPTNETSKRMTVTLQGKVVGIDDSAYTLPSSDTLSYVVSSMLSFVDTLPRYRIRIINKYTITLTAASSPDGRTALNDAIAEGRARALKRYLACRFGRQIDTLLTLRRVGEDWSTLIELIRDRTEVKHRDEILALIAAEKNPDRREAKLRRHYPEDFAWIKANLYPYLRAVNFRYDLRRVGMVKDTVHTTELDTAYARGVELLQKRKYAEALYILNEYNDRNTVVAHLSMGHDERALELLDAMPKDAVTEYLRAIACSRLGRKEEGREHFLQACRLDPRMEYRANLDPEITELLKR